MSPQPYENIQDIRSQRIILTTTNAVHITSALSTRRHISIEHIGVNGDYATDSTLLIRFYNGEYKAAYPASAIFVNDVVVYDFTTDINVSLQSPTINTHVIIREWEDKRLDVINIGANREYD